jgi:hypothetical protein
MESALGCINTRACLSSNRADNSEESGQPPGHPHSNLMMVHTRRRTRRKFSPGNGGAARAPEGLSVSLVDEALGIVMGGVGLFLLLSLGSADPSTPVLTDMVSPEANWGGLVGHWLASTLTYALGAGAFVLVGLLWQAAFLWITHASRQPRVLTGVGGFLIIVGLR